MSIKHWILPLFTSLMACQPAYGNRHDVHPATARTSLAESPYQVELIDSRGAQLDRYFHLGRHYVHGDKGSRYTIRVHNPTARRVEAVVSVDGLDVIDGRPAGVQKRGYVITPYDSVDIDGFRVSDNNVAAFRFSSVKNSYAGRKGKARNVGVIGVAIFEEKHRPVVVHPHYRHRPRHQNHYGSGDSAKTESKRKTAPPAVMDDAESSMGNARPSEAPQKSRRSGLGTEFGERRYSATTSTRFIRAHHRRPSVLGEIRYNDARGLRALGIYLRHHHDELYTRETANPFPMNNRRYSQPPPR